MAAIPAVREPPTAQPPQHRGAESLHPFANRGTALCATDHRTEDGRHERALRVASTALPPDVIDLIQTGKQCGRICFSQRHRFHLLVG